MTNYAEQDFVGNKFEVVAGIWAGTKNAWFSLAE